MLTTGSGTARTLIKYLAEYNINQLSYLKKQNKY